MIRKLLHYWLMALLLGPGSALALEIGEIQVSSALNQLFDAKIPLPVLTPEELGKVSVKLAGPPMFKEFGLDRTPALGNLVFAIEYNAEGQVYVRVVSTQPIREPSLALLLEFGWPRGKTFREFTVFLDPVQRLVKRSGGRTKTVMETSPSVVYGPESATAPPVAQPESKPEPPTPLAAAPETITPPVQWATPAASATAPLPPPEPVKTYSPGDGYLVAPGEGLWGIALKTRPDPGITREQMMQALFRANPQAFSKAGIPGLKIGATLRIPTLREIADLTGSPVAQRLAEKEPVATPVDATKPDAKPAPVAATPVAADLPQAFPLSAVAVPEPVAVTSEPVLKPIPTISALEPTKVTDPVITELKPKTPESLVQILEPVSATPLLSLAMTEIMTSYTQIPAVVPLPAMVPVVAAPVQETTADAGSPSVIEPVSPVVEAPPAIEPASPVVETPPAIEPASPVVETPPAIEPASPVVETPPVVETASPVVETPPAIEPASPVVETPPVIEPASPVVETPPVIETASPVVETPPVVETASPVVETPPVVETASPVVETPPVIAAPATRYGPVAANERLWTIATKVRPDPAIAMDHMMRALFMANPQAFSKAGNMNSLKVGATLRVPTLQEIVDLTGSKAAKRLLEAPAPTAEPDR